MQELKAFNEQRAEIYWWFSSLFIKELTEKDIEAYQHAEIRTFLAGLAENKSLKTSTDKLVDALNRLQDRPDAQLELSADFCDLFLKSDKHGALPYASLYIGESGLLNDKPATEMAKLMEQNQIAVNKEINEPADHLAIELDYLGNLIIRGNEAGDAEELEEAFEAQREFIEQHLLTWIPLFENKCKQFDEFGLYSAAASLLVAFTQLDSTFLSGE